MAQEVRQAVPEKEVNGSIKPTPRKGPAADRTAQRMMPLVGTPFLGFCFARALGTRLARARHMSRRGAAT